MGSLGHSASRYLFWGRLAELSMVRRHLRDAFVYRPLAFAEPAESIELALDGLAVRPGETVAGIISSGDILLAALGTGAARVFGFDANPTQTALARLKAMLCRDESLEVALAFLGLTGCAAHERRRLWCGMRARLGEEAQQLDRFDVGRGLLNCGTTRKLFRWTMLSLRACLGGRNFRRLVGPGSDRGDRLRLLEELRGRAAYRLALSPVLQAGRGLFQHFLYPPALCANSDHPARALEDILQSYARLFEVGFHENPVFERFLTGRIPAEQARHIYSPAAWAALRRRAGDVHLATAPIDEGLARLEAGTVDAFYLSNAPDYLRPAGLRALSRAIAHAARPGARVYYLSLDSECPFERCGVEIRFSRRPEREQALMRADPVGLYRFIGVRGDE